MNVHTELHRAYCESTSFELPLNNVSERQWHYASTVWKIEPDDVRLIVKERLKGIASGDRKQASIYLRNLIGTFGEDGDQDLKLAEFAQELAAIRAKLRKPRQDAGKVTVLSATHRPTEPAQPDAKSAGDVIRALREAANE